MSLKPRTRERQAELQQLLHARREMPELHLMRELLLLRYDDAKHKLVQVAPEELLKLQGEVKSYMDLLALFDRSPLTNHAPTE